MTYLKIGGQEFELEQLYSVLSDAEWANRNAYFAKIRAEYNVAKKLFVDGAAWSTYAEGKEAEDRSDYCVAGKLIDYRDGYIGVYMGRKTEAERLAEELADAKAALALLGVTDEQEEITDDDA